MLVLVLALVVVEWLFAEPQVKPTFAVFEQKLVVVELYQFLVGLFQVLAALFVAEVVKFQVLVGLKQSVGP